MCMYISIQKHVCVCVCVFVMKSIRTRQPDLAKMVKLDKNISQLCIYKLQLEKCWTMDVQAWTMYYNVYMTSASDESVTLAPANCNISVRSMGWVHNQHFYEHKSNGMYFDKIQINIWRIQKQLHNLKGHKHCMPHVQRTSNIRRRHRNHKWIASSVKFWPKITLGLPPNIQKLQSIQNNADTYKWKCVSKRFQNQATHN